MKIKDNIDSQHKDESTLYLLQQGMFYHAYNEAAEFFHLLMDYKKRTLYLPHGETYELVGFPLSSLDNVVAKVLKSNPHASIYFNKTIITIKL